MKRNLTPDQVRELRRRYEQLPLSPKIYVAQRRHGDRVYKRTVVRKRQKRIGVVELAKELGFPNVSSIYSIIKKDYYKEVV